MSVEMPARSKRGTGPPDVPSVIRTSLAGLVAFCAWANVASWSARPSISSAKTLIVSLRRFVQLQRIELLPSRTPRRRVRFDCADRAADKCNELAPPDAEHVASRPTPVLNETIAPPGSGSSLLHCGISAVSGLGILVAMGHN